MAQEARGLEDGAGKRGEHKAAEEQHGDPRDEVVLQALDVERLSGQRPPHRPGLGELGQRREQEEEEHHQKALLGEAGHSAQQVPQESASAEEKACAHGEARNAEAGDAQIENELLRGLQQRARARVRGAHEETRDPERGKAGEQSHEPRVGAQEVHLALRFGVAVLFLLHAPHFDVDQVPAWD